MAAEDDVETEGAVTGVEEPLTAGLSGQHPLQLRGVEVVRQRSRDAAVGEQRSLRGWRIELEEYDENVVPAHAVDRAAAEITADRREREVGRMHDRKALFAGVGLTAPIDPRVPPAWRVDCKTVRRDLHAATTTTSASAVVTSTTTVIGRTMVRACCHRRCDRRSVSGSMTLRFPRTGSARAMPNTAPTSAPTVGEATS